MSAGHGVAAMDDFYGDGEDVEDVSDDVGCAICDGPLVPLGALGNTLHLRCRNCGMDQSREVGILTLRPLSTGSRS